MRIGVIIGSTRPGRKGEQVAAWFMDQVAKHQEGSDSQEVTYELVDLADFDLPLLSEPTVPGAANGQYENPATTRWAEKIATFDGYVFITAEYNHSVPAALKNAFDVLYVEWVKKSIAFVSYGALSGARAVEHWRGIVANANMLQARSQVSLPLFDSVQEDGTIKPPQPVADGVSGMLSELEDLTRLSGTHRG
ncbi:NADPH-dependent FMN reductase [Kytococcus sedentarius]|uniref:NADPH-dependent FMN reductase n=1 Tax=Kytococcus sedentarius TaxID=1276 RepID=UPI0035BC1AF8